MIRLEACHLFDSPAQTLVTPVNTTGVMDRGLALAFRRSFPSAMYAAYSRVCHTGSLRVGSLYLWRGTAPSVLFFPTHNDWRDAARLDYVEAGLRAFVDAYRELGITSAAFPLLGCGDGGLDPEDVRRLLTAYLDPLPITTTLHLHSARLPGRSDTPEPPYALAS
jgi:O-acetyl-ADP-ribose deacetylase (regulator of RNase III)